VIDTKYKLSYSEKRDIIVCPHRYKLQSIDKIPQTFDLRRLLGANVIDLALSDWIETKFAGKLEDIAQARYVKYIVSNKKALRWKSKSDMKDQEQKARETARKLEKAMRDHGLCLSDATTQTNVKAKLKLSDGTQLKLTGRMDLFYTEHLWIYDLKTTEDKRWLDVDQLVYYDFVLSTMLGKKIKKCGFLAPLINPPVQEIPFVGKEQWQGLLNDLQRAIDTIEVGDFPDTGDEKQDCFLCFAKAHCKRNKHSAELIQVGRKMMTGL
jgi:hypothetical protein